MISAANNVSIGASLKFSKYSTSQNLIKPTVEMNEDGHISLFVAAE